MSAFDFAGADGPSVLAIGVVVDGIGEAREVLAELGDAFFASALVLVEGGEDGGTSALIKLVDFRIDPAMAGGVF